MKSLCDYICNLIFGLVVLVIKNPKKYSQRSVLFWILWFFFGLVFFSLSIAMASSGDLVATFLSLLFLLWFITIFIPCSVAFVKLNIDEMKKIKTDPWIVKPEPGITDDCWPC